MNDPVARVLWEGPIYSRNPFAFVNREIVSNLARQKGVAVSVLNTDEKRAGQREDFPLHPELATYVGASLDGKADVHVGHMGNPKLVPPPEGRWILFQPWEVTSLYREWLLYFRHLADEVWVYSHWNREQYLQDGLSEERVHVIPLGVNPDLYRPGPRPEKPKWTSDTNKSFKFLFVGGMVYRKGVDLLLDAFARTFSKTDDVCLVIKGSSGTYVSPVFAEQIHALQEQEDGPEVLYLEDHIPGPEMPGLYRECDCLVHPYRGEGFALPVAEAMACGLPVVATAGGACDDFLNGERGYMLSRVEKCGIRMAKETVREPMLLEPGVEELSEVMHHVVSHPQEAKEKGAQGSAHVREHFTWEQSTRAIAERLKSRVNCTPVRRFHPVHDSQPESGDFLEAERLLAEGAYERASELLLRLHEAFPGRYEAPAGLGLVAWYQERFQEAQRWFEEALSHNPTDEDTLFNYCDVCLKLGEPQNAENALRKTISLKPALTEVARYLERLQQEAARGGGFRFEKFVGQRETIKHGEKLLREGLLEDAAKIFTEVLETDSDDFEALCDMGVIAYYSQDYENAFHWLVKSLQIAPTVQDTLVNLFDAALKLRRVREIEPVLRQAVQMRPELADISAILSEIEKKGDEIYGVDSYEAIDPVEEGYQKGLEELENGELNKATLSFLDVVDRKPYHDRALTGLGVIAYYHGNLADSFALFQHAVELNPLNVDAVLNWYDAAKKLDRGDVVKPYLENIAEVEERPAVQTALQELTD